MNPATRHRLRDLDRAILGLCEERARLCASLAADDQARRPALEDLLRRHQGRLDADAVEGLMRAIELHTAREVKP